LKPISGVAGFAALTIFTLPANAIMFVLTDMPTNRTAAACHDWAAEQDSDALYMWGQQADGKSSESVALSRLPNYCVAGDMPEIAKFGSGFGFDRDYCKRNPRDGICRQQ
jgi:hypothetical protein